MGILCELWLSERILNFDLNLRQEITDFIFSKYSKFPIQTKDFARLFDILSHDKKNINNQIKPVLLEQIGLARHDLACSKELCLVAFHAYSTL
jgi:3-dehydroquinate synthase